MQQNDEGKYAKDASGPGTMSISSNRHSALLIEDNSLYASSTSFHNGLLRKGL